MPLHHTAGHPTAEEVEARAVVVVAEDSPQKTINITGTITYACTVGKKNIMPSNV